MINTDVVDERIMALLRDDGRLSNREVARRLDVSEGTVRQRLKKLQDAGAIRIGVVVDANRFGFSVSSWIRVSVSPEHTDRALRTFSEMREVRYVAASSGRYNVLIVVIARNSSELMRVVNEQIQTCRGVSQVDVRIIAQTVKHDFNEVVVRPTGELPKAPRTRPISRSS